jgi:hypothetical protein
MSTNSDFKLVKEKNLDEKTTLKITKNRMSGRIFVEFLNTEYKVLLQKNFQDSLDGRQKSEEFSKSIRNTEQLLGYFGIKNNKE